MNTYVQDLMEKKKGKWWKKWKKLEEYALMAEENVKEISEMI